MDMEVRDSKKDRPYSPVFAVIYAAQYNIILMYIRTH